MILEGKSNVGIMSTGLSNDHIKSNTVVYAIALLIIFVPRIIYIKEIIGAN